MDKRAIDSLIDLSSVATSIFSEIITRGESGTRAQSMNEPRHMCVCVCANACAVVA